MQIHQQTYKQKKRTTTTKDSRKEEVQYGRSKKDKSEFAHFKKITDSHTYTE